VPAGQRGRRVQLVVRDRAGALPPGVGGPADRGGRVVTAPGPVALLLPGQGAQHARMATGLYGAEPAFTAAMDEVLDAFGDARLRDDWLHADDPAVVDHVTRSQRLLFAVDYALGRLTLSWGVEPVALLGHSIGEVAGAVLAD